MTTPMQHRGFTLIELMIGITIGLFMLIGLTSIFVNSSDSQHEMQRAAEQIENGRYAMEKITQDLHLAGYYGRYTAYADGTSLPDPCVTNNATAQVSALGFPVQGIVAVQTSSGIPTAIPDLTATSCGTFLPPANLQPGSDILVIRRAETTPLAVGATALTNEIYLQANQVSAEIQFGNGAAITSAKKADGTAADIFLKDGVTSAEIRKYRVHIYFVAPCSVPAGATCGPNDDQGRPIPTLKRLELTVDAANNLTLTFNVVPLAEGIEALKIEYGIDNAPNVVNGSTQRVGDGAPDLYIPNSVTLQPGTADWPSVVSVKVFVVGRQSEPTAGYTDTKTYSVATAAAISYGPYNDQYKRHGYSSNIRLTNLGARRETP
jgi:type IV pilus assembly protein PilW